MQLQLHWPHTWLKSTQLLLFSHDTCRYHQYHCANDAPLSPQRGTPPLQQWQSLPTPHPSRFSHSYPPTQASSHICLLFWRSPFKQSRSVFHRFLSSNYKKKNGRRKTQWKSKHMKRVSGSRASICVCTLIPHSKLTFASNTDKHRCVAADRQVRISAYCVSFINAPVWK